MDCSSLILSSLCDFKNYFVDYNVLLAWKTLSCFLTTRRKYNNCRRSVNNFLYPNGNILNVTLYMLDDNDKLIEYDFSAISKYMRNSLINNLYYGNQISWHRIFQFFGLNRDNSKTKRYYLKLEYQLENNIYYYVYEFDYGRKIKDQIIFPIINRNEIDEFNKSDEMKNQIVFCTLDNENYSEELEKYMGPKCDFYGGKIPCRFIIGNGKSLSYTDLNFEEFNYSRVENRDDYVNF